MEEGQLAALAKLAIFDKRRGPDKKITQMPTSPTQTVGGLGGLGGVGGLAKQRGPDMMRAKFARGSSAEVEHLEHLEHLGRRHQYAHPITSVTAKLVSPLTPDS
jgi:hypothetical protein